VFGGRGVRLRRPLRPCLILAVALSGGCAPPVASGHDVRADEREYGVEFGASVGTAVAPVLVVRRRGAVPFGPDDRETAESAVRQHCAGQGLVFTGGGHPVPGLPGFHAGEWTFAGACL
jgi:hypothetical protein